MLHIDLLQHKIIHLSKMAFKVGYIILQNKTAVCRNGSLEDEIVHKFGLNPLDSYTKKIQNQMRKKKVNISCTRYISIFQANFTRLLQKQSGKEYNLSLQFIASVYRAMGTWATLKSPFRKIYQAYLKQASAIWRVRRMSQGQGRPAVQSLSSSVLFADVIALHLPNCSINSRSSKACFSVCLHPLSPTYPSPAASEVSCIPK